MRIVSYVPSLEPTAAEVLATALGERGIEEIASPPARAQGDGGLTARLVAGIVEWEELLAREAPDGLLLAAADDSGLAAALCAAKLELPMLSIASPPPTEAGIDPAPASNGDLIALLASDSADPGAPAREIADLLASLPTLRSR